MNIAVIGAGLMGHGIALCFANKGFQVKIYDANSKVRKQLLKRIETSMQQMGTAKKNINLALKNIEVVDNVAETVKDSDLVIEAILEKLNLKQQMFKEIEKYAKPKCIFASNTSVIQITKIMGKLKNKERALGTHWWNPPHLIPLVEVIKTKWTNPTVAKKVMQVLSKVGKQPVLVNKDVPGFVGNRLQHAMWREAISLVNKGICDAQSVDNVVKSSFGRRLAVLGPLENADLIGTDLTLDIHNQILFDLDCGTTSSPYLKRLVNKNKLGMKNGHGFRKWTKTQANNVQKKVATHLLSLGT